MMGYSSIASTQFYAQITDQKITTDMEKLMGGWGNVPAEVLMIIVFFFLHLAMRYLWSILPKIKRTRGREFTLPLCKYVLLFKRTNDTD